MPGLRASIGLSLASRAFVPYIHISLSPLLSSPSSLFPFSSPHTHREGWRGELVNWYLKEMEADIETIEELVEKNVLVESH